MVTAAAAWSIFGNDVLPADEDPKGSEQPRTPWLNITKENHRPRRLDNRGDAEMASCGTYTLG